MKQHEASNPTAAVKPRDDNLLVAAFVLILACLLLVNGLYVYNRLSTSQPGFPTHALTSHDVAVTPSLQAGINNVSENNKPDPAFTLDKGQTMLIMNFTITNRTKQPQDFYPVNDLYVRDRQGQYQPLHPSMYVTKPIGSGRLAPGASLSGQISFGVPAKDSDLLLYVDTGWNNEAPVVFHVLQ